MKPRDIPHDALRRIVEDCIRNSPDVSTWPTAMRDQRQAADDDAHRYYGAIAERMRDLEPDRTWGEEIRSDTAGQAAFVAAVLRCKWCSHLRGGHSLQPAICDLNRDVVRCLRCAKTWLTPVDDDVCEICGSSGNVTFCPALVKVGPVLVAANIAECCWHLLSSERKAA